MLKIMLLASPLGAEAHLEVESGRVTASSEFPGGDFLLSVASLPRAGEFPPTCSAYIEALYVRTAMVTFFTSFGL